MALARDMASENADWSLVSTLLEALESKAESMLGNVGEEGEGRGQGQRLLLF